MLTRAAAFVCVLLVTACAAAAAPRVIVREGDDASAAGAGRTFGSFSHPAMTFDGRRFAFFAFLEPDFAGSLWYAREREDGPAPRGFDLTFLAFGRNSPSSLDRAPSSRPAIPCGHSLAASSDGSRARAIKSPIFRA